MLQKLKFKEWLNHYKSCLHRDKDRNIPNFLEFCTVGIKTEITAGKAAPIKSNLQPVEVLSKFSESSSSYHFDHDDEHSQKVSLASSIVSTILDMDTTSSKLSFILNVEKTSSKNQPKIVQKFP